MGTDIHRQSVSTLASTHVDLCFLSPDLCRAKKSSRNRGVSCERVDEGAKARLPQIASALQMFAASTSALIGTGSTESLIKKYGQRIN
jgi:hypothetical protein